MTAQNGVLDLVQRWTAAEQRNDPEPWTGCWPMGSQG
jgi:hypothetical protein